MNSYLKELRDICGINKNIARHTFATMVTPSNGVPIETGSKLIGYSSLKTTQIYAKVLDQKISAFCYIAINQTNGLQYSLNKLSILTDLI